MGAWGPGVFDSDMALDLRADVEARLAGGTTAERLATSFLAKPCVFDDPDDGVIALLAVAETLHELGRPEPRILERARAVLARGADLNRWQKDDPKRAKARAKELSRLSKKLASKPPPKRKLSVPKSKRTRLVSGDVVAFALEPSRKQLCLLLVERLLDLGGSRYPVLALFDWVGSRVPPPEHLGELPLRLHWREDPEFGRSWARLIVTDMEKRVDCQSGYEVVAKLDVRAYPTVPTGGGAFIGLAEVRRAVREDLEPLGMPRGEIFDGAANPSAEERRFALAMGAILRAQNDEPLDRLPRRPSRPTARSVLRDFWEVKSRDSARFVVWQLAQYGRSYEALRLLTSEGAREARGQDDGPRQVAFVRSHFRAIRKARLLAWDLGRLSNVASWCWEAGYFSEREVWSYLMPAARRVRAAYSSWRQFADAYCMGRRYWFDEDEEVRATADELLADAKSPWRTLRW